MGWKARYVLGDVEQDVYPVYDYIDWRLSLYTHRWDGATMTLEQAQALATRIQRETHGVSTVVQADITPAALYSSSFHITVKKPGVLQMCIYSPAQWDDRKHLINKWSSHLEERGNMFIERKEYPLGNNQNAVSYEIHDGNGHVAQLSPTETETLYQWLASNALQLHTDVNGIQVTSDNLADEEPPDLVVEMHERIEAPGYNELGEDEPLYVHPEDRAILQKKNSLH